jgi:hypothetical protein
LKQEKKIPKNNRFHASSCKQKTSNIVETFAKGHCIFTVSLLLKILWKKKTISGESHQTWYFNYIHTATLIIKIIASFSSKI